MKDPDEIRRALVLTGLGALSATALAKPVSAASLTPAATEGPFYPTQSMRRADADNDLVKIVGTLREAGGEVIVLRGRLMHKDDTPRAGHRIEIWQCDMNGKYLHTADRQGVEFDPAFQGFGHDITDDDGSYVFRTIKPVVYPGRTPHIHVKVLDGRQELLTTQFYIDGHPANRKDRLFNRLSDSEAKAVSMVFTPQGQAEEAIIDIVV